MNSNRAINDSVVEARFSWEPGPAGRDGALQRLWTNQPPDFAEWPRACVLCHGWANTGRSKKLVTCTPKMERVRFFRFGDFLVFFSGWQEWYRRDFMTSSSYMVFSSVWNFDRCRVMERFAQTYQTGISSFSFEQRQSLKLGGRVFTLDSTIHVVNVLSRSFKVFYLLFGWWTMCGCFVLSGDYWKLHFFCLHGFSFLGSGDQKFSPKNNHTPHQHNAKKLQDEAEAHQELLHFQNAYPSDPRAFFFDPKGQTGRHLRPSTPENQIPLAGAGVSDVSGECLLYRCTKKGPKKEGLNWFSCCQCCWLFFFWILKIHRSAPSRNKEKWENCRAKSWKTFQELWVDVTHLSSWQENGRSEPTQVERLSDFLAFTRFPTTWSWDSCSGSLEIGWKWNENCLFLSSMLQSCWLMSKGWLIKG